jgi:hypothetical protein
MTEMKKILLSTILVLAVAATGYAIPVKTSEVGTVPAREFSPAQDQCYLGYYNICSGWVWYWSGYCYGMFTDYLPSIYGTVFDLAGCPDDCRHLNNIWWAMKRFNSYGNIDLEIYCADAFCCPIGQPLAGVYGYVPDIATAWQNFVFDGLELCPCDETGTFIVMVTDHTCSISTSPYSDHVELNAAAGCQEWRCVGHSFFYKNVVSYCDVYGAPGPMWVSGPDFGCGPEYTPDVPPGCHDYTYPTGCWTEFIFDVYIDCLGATATENASWSEIKSLYR